MEDLIKRVYIPAVTLENVQCFAHSHPQKPARFSAGQSERFHPAKPSFYPSAVTAGITHYTLQAKSCAKGIPFGNPFLSECVATLPPKCKISGIGQPVPGADLYRLFAYMGFLLYRPYKPFQFITSVCTVLFDIPNFFAVWRTVAFSSMM